MKVKCVSNGVSVVVVSRQMVSDAIRQGVVTVGDRQIAADLP